MVIAKGLDGDRAIGEADMDTRADGARRHEVSRVETELYRAQVAQDLDALDRLLSEDLTYVHSTGVAESKAAYLTGVAQGLYEYETIHSRNVRLRFHGDAAVMHGIVDMRVGERGTPRDLIHLLFTLVWVKETGGWRLTLRQATRIPT